MLLDLFRVCNVLESSQALDLMDLTLLWIKDLVHEEEVHEKQAHISRNTSIVFDKQVNNAEPVSRGQCDRINPRHRCRTCDNE